MCIRVVTSLGKKNCATCCASVFMNEKNHIVLTVYFLLILNEMHSFLFYVLLYIIIRYLIWPYLIFIYLWRKIIAIPSDFFSRKILAFRFYSLLLVCEETCFIFRFSFLDVEDTFYFMYYLTLVYFLRYFYWNSNFHGIIWQCDILFALFISSVIRK